MAVRGSSSIAGAAAEISRMRGAGDIALTTDEILALSRE